MKNSMGTDSSSALQDMRILLVEDSADIQMLVTYFHRRVGVEVTIDRNALIKTLARLGTRTDDSPIPDHEFGARP